MKWQLVLFYLCLARGSLINTDTFDPAKILNDDVARESFYLCMLDQAPCTAPEERFFRGNLYDLYHDYCNRCSDLQVKKYFIGVLWFLLHEPEKFEQMVDAIKREWLKRGYPSNKRIF